MLQLIFSYITPLKPIHLCYTAYYLIFKSQKIFGAKKHQKFYLMSINNSFGFLLVNCNSKCHKNKNIKQI